MEFWEKYLDKLDADKVDVTNNIAEMVLEIEPEAVKALPYGVPGYKYKNKNLIAFAAHKAHFGIYPFSPKIVKEIVKKYTDIDYAEGTLRFSYDNLPKRELIEQIILLRKNEIS